MKTIAEAATALGMHEKTIRNWIAGGKVVASERPNKRLFFTPRQFEWLRQIAERNTRVEKALDAT